MVNEVALKEAFSRIKDEFSNIKDEIKRLNTKVENIVNLANHTEVYRKNTNPEKNQEKKEKEKIKEVKPEIEVHNSAPKEKEEIIDADSYY